MNKMQIDAVKKELSRRVHELWREFDSVQPAELLHYTTPSGVRGILGRGELWLTDVKDVKNDKREGDYGLDVIKSVVTKLQTSLPEALVSGVRNLESIYGSNRAWTQYITCFCSAGEQRNMLSKFADGDGCALVFDYETLLAGREDVTRGALFRVLYDRNDQERLIEQTLKHSIDLEAQLDVQDQDCEKEYWGRLVENKLMMCAIRFKDARWRREEEFRIMVTSRDGIEVFDDAGGRKRTKLGIKVGDLKRVIRYGSTQLDEAEIRTLLKKLNFGKDVEIVESAL